MSQQVINIGTTSNDGTGDPLRTAWQKTNENFTELYVGKCPIAGPGSSQAFAVGAFTQTGNALLAQISGNVLVGTTVDDGINKLQVNGGIKATTFGESGTWTPTPNAGTFSVATGAYVKAGKLVTLFFDVVVGTGGGTQITIPFTPNLTTSGALYVSGQAFAAGTTTPMAVVGAGGNVIFLRTVGPGVSFSAMTFTAGAVINGSITFTIS